MKTFSLLLSLTLASLAFSQSAIAEYLAATCSCQCGQSCRKVCRVVCETKKETKWFYGCKCEDYCIPGRSCITGTKCVTDPCTCRTHTEFCWKPSCGPVRTRTVLTKVPKTIEKTVYRCVVQDCCPGCGCAQVDAAATEQMAQRFPELDPARIPTDTELTLPQFMQLATHAAPQEPLAERETAEEGAPAPRLSSGFGFFKRLNASR